MDMLNILKNLDAAEKGETSVKTSENTNDMKMILESFDAVQECGMEGSAMPAPAPQPDPVTMNVTLNARGKDAIEDLLDIMKDKDASIDRHVAHDGHDDMKRLMALASDADPEMGEEPEMGEDYENEPEEEYRDTEYMTKDISGGLNRQKKSYKPAAGGDNPMALEDQIKADLQAALQEKLSKKKI
jgi:hypothetical protein